MRDRGQFYFLRCWLGLGAGGLNLTVFLKICFSMWTIEKVFNLLYLLIFLFNLYAEYNMRNTGLDEAQAGIKIAGRSISNLRYADDTTLMAESEELEPFDESERGE